MIRLPLILRRVVQAVLVLRHVLALLISAAVGLVGVLAWPLPIDDPLLVVIADIAPRWALTIAIVYHVLWYTTPFLLAHVAFAALFVLFDTRVPPIRRALPTYPPVAERDELCLVLGEVHHPTERQPSPTPDWLTIPARGCYAGILVLGATGAGKTAGAMYPYCEQLFGFKAQDATRKVAGLVLEVKGHFCHAVRGILQQYGRAADYREISLDRTCRYNPLAEGDAYALAFGITSIMVQTFGRGKDPFWEAAATNLVKHLILLHQLLHNYVTFMDVYECALDMHRLEDRLGQAGRLPHLQPGRVRVAMAQYGAAREATHHRVKWEVTPDAAAATTDATPTVLSLLQTAGIACDIEAATARADLTLQWEALRLWYHHDWMNLDPRLRASIVEGVSTFLSVFATDPDVNYVFCPPKDAGDDDTVPTLPSFKTVIDEGLVIGLNFPAHANPALTRTIAVLAKTGLYQALLAQIPHAWRDVALIVDESQLVVTAGENHPGGDEQSLGLTRETRLIPIFATHGLVSWRSALPGESWRTLLQQFRTRIVLAQSDDFSAQTASDLFGRSEQLRPTYSVNETGRDASVSWLSGRTVAASASLGTTKTYAWRREPLFDASEFLRLKNMEAIVSAYDGVNPLPPRRLYLKPHFLPIQRTYFEHLADGRL